MIMLRIAMNTLRTSSSPGDISCTISFVHHVAEELFGTSYSVTSFVARNALL